MPNIANPSASPPPAPGEDNTQPGIIATTITVTLVADIVVALRLMTRKWVVKSIGWDDWTIIAAALGITIGCALVLVEVHYGFGRHKGDLPHESYVEFTRYSYGEWIQTFSTLMFTKVSICLFLLRIVINKSFVRSLQALIVVLVLSNVILTILWIAQCRPVELSWWAPETPDSCFTQTQLQQIILAQAIIAIASDFILATYPVFILRKIQMAKRIKMGLCILMGLGVITGCFCIVRTIGNWQNVNQDPTWNSVVNCWEVCIGIVAASIPALRPGYKSLKARIRTYSLSRSAVKIPEKTGTTKPSVPTKPSEFNVSRNVPVIPSAVLRPDISDTNAMCSTASAEDASNFSPEMFGIMKTTKVDLESQRTGSREGGTGSESFRDAERADSRTALKGAGTLV
ncbi:MAG: hypothetical protein LQ340_003027 [Diploschistes diacapsis]|nr:MAG: hypothetical protein LQ340_003027 [Diploschistes diacapsis]